MLSIKSWSQQFLIKLYYIFIRKSYCIVFNTCIARAQLLVYSNFQLLRLVKEFVKDNMDPCKYAMGDDGDGNAWSGRPERAVAHARFTP
jgi:hypothetical protein